MSLEARFRLTRAAFRLDVKLVLPSSGFTALIGRSGSGKTTLLRCIAGLERIPAGELRVAGRIFQDARSFVPAHARPFGYVFQEASLFPHLSVRGNLEFGYKRIPQAARSVPFEQAVELLSLQELLERDPRSLSGGQRQRVAIARALLTSPDLLLMDEPLASLDLSSKSQILPYLESVQRTLHIPVIYVTHSPEEVLRLADYVVLLEQGAMLAEGPLNEILTRPDLWLSQESGASSVLSGTVSHHVPNYHLTYVQVPGGSVAISQKPLSPGQRTRVQVRARDVSIALSRPLQTSISNVLEASVLDVHPDRDPAQCIVRLQLGSEVLLSRVTLHSVAELHLTPGTQVFAQIKSVAIMD